MKQGGVSWNQGFHSKKGVRAQFVCEKCGRKYKMGWAKDNHERLCKDRK